MKTILLCLCTAAIVTAACHKETERPAEGPMERAGKKIDDAAAKVAEEAKDAKDTVKRKANDAGL